MRKKEKRLWLESVLLLLLAMSAVALLGEVSRQDWAGKAQAYPQILERRAERRAQELLDDMTLEEKVGQMFIARGQVPEHAGGVLLERAMHTPRGLRIMAEEQASSRFVWVDAPGDEVVLPVFGDVRTALEAEGVQVVWDWRRSPVEAVRSGAMLLVSGNCKEDMGRVLRAVELGALPAELVDAAVLKILTVKIYWGMLE